MASATSIFLQEPSFKWKSHSYSPQLQPQNPFARTHIKIRKNLKKFSINCLFTNDNSAADQRLVSKSASKKSEIKQNPVVEIVAETLQNLLMVLRKPAVAAVVVGLLLLYDPSSALAASGGRMGGRSFSSRSAPSPSQSYSVPRMGAGSGFTYSAPYYVPSPFGGVYMGPAVGIGSSFSIIMIAFVAFVLVSGFLSDGSQGSVLTATDKTTVLKLQVGLLGLGRSLQKDLNRIAENADTSTAQGLHYVLTETVLALLRHPDYCISGYSSVDVKRSMEEGEKRFNQLSIEERGKFDEETLINVNSIKKAKLDSPKRMWIQQRVHSYHNLGGCRRRTQAAVYQQ